jgi:hypothetical protein
VEIGLAEAERSSYLAAVGRNTIASFAGVILLMGSLRRTEMEGAIGRCVLDLPLDNERTLLNLWQDQIAELATAVERPGLALRIIQGKETLRPRSERAMNSVRLSFELDSQELRGTGGVLRDMTEGYHADDRVLVATGAQCPLMCVERVVRTLAAADGDVVVAAHMDGTPSGFMLVRCGVLRKLPAVGFIDMKEQGLPLIAREHKVRVVQFRQATGSVGRGIYRSAPAASSSPGRVVRIGI